MLVGDLTFPEVASYLLVLLRTSSLLVTMPVFGSPNLPPVVKAMLSMVISFALASAVKIDPNLLPRDAISLGVLAVGEFMVGVAMGIMLRLLLTAVQMLGQMAGFQMGFAVANVLDPLNGGQISVLSQFGYLMSVLVFLSVGGHHWFFRALADSFTLVPPGQFDMTAGLFTQIMDQASAMFSLAIRLGAPVIGAALITQVALGILAKTVPQMNILMVGFPITISVGFTFFTITLLVMLPQLAKMFAGYGPVLARLLQAM